MRALARWRSRSRQVSDQWTTWRREWAVERDLERVLGGTGPIIVGPWLSEVGYEVLYWVPFLRWVKAAYRLPEDRLIAMSRGGTASWYRGIASRYVEIFDQVPPVEVSARLAAGGLKQREISDFDRRLVVKASRALGLARTAPVLHPSLMFRWFSQFWSGHETLGFVERHTRYARIEPPDDVDKPLLPKEYVAIKLYGSRALPDEPDVQLRLQTLVSKLSERFPVVQLDTGLGFDDHADCHLDASNRLISLNGQFEARTNLAVQTSVIAGATMFFGTCGSLAWLAPLLGVATVPLFTDASFLHAHLHLARRVYGRVGGGRFSPVDLSGLAESGLLVSSAADPGVGGRPA